MRLFRQLGLDRVHLAARVAADWRGLATTHPETIASLTLVCPTGLDATPLGALTSRVLVLTGDQGTPAEAISKAMPAHPEASIITGRVRWTDLTPAEWRGHDEQGVAELKASGIFQPFEKEYFRKDGSRVPVLLGGALFEGGGNEGVAFVLDLTEQKRAQERLRASVACGRRRGNSPTSIA